MQPPSYFETIRSEAEGYWDLLESKPKLAGPWHQLFEQVQVPRHVLSELLQNADDAGATEASVHLEADCFVFTHNGRDFTADDFASLCNFCFSNKRTLHTIGFRGIGFKSTFSLGDTVELRTPSLSVVFERGRFTQPTWQPDVSTKGKRTEIRVAVRDDHRKREVEKNFQEWIKSPVSLLFFKNLRRLRISDQELHWGSLGSGPVPGTEWWALHHDPDGQFLLATSEVEPFPDDALVEIKTARNIANEHGFGLPPCKVEIVLGARGRLYVALPTGVETTLPFACNAPFMQDPARRDIKPPSMSPTNRWLLGRVGSLAASVMLRWLEDSSSSLEERSRAYELMPDVNGGGDSLEVSCTTAVIDAFARGVDDHPYVLTSTGHNLSARAVVFPDELLDVWPAAKVESLFDHGGRPSLCRHVSNRDRKKLVRWNAVERVAKEDVLRTLLSVSPPKPATWRKLTKLWAFVAPEVTEWQRSDYSEVRIVPVQGRDELYAAGEVVRLGEDRLLQSDADWEFLSDHLLVVNQNWLRFVAGRRGHSEDVDSEEMGREVSAARKVLETLELDESSSADLMLGRVAEAFFSQGRPSVVDCVRIAQIAAKLRANVEESLLFVTVDEQLRHPADVILCDLDGSIEGLLPEGWREEHLLHPRYTAAFRSCSAEDWRNWVTTGRGGLRTFIPLVETSQRFGTDLQLERHLLPIADIGTPSYPYRTTGYYPSQWYELADFDFPRELVSHWLEMDPGMTAWRVALGHLLLTGPATWNDMLTAEPRQSRTDGQVWRRVQTKAIPAAWVRRFRTMECLPDTRGTWRQPADLLRRTRQTEALIDVEAFIDRELDTEENEPLLTSLGVRDTPPGPNRILDCIRALSKSERPPVAEVEKWYRRLDQMADGCSTGDLGAIKEALLQETVVFTDGGQWLTGASVYLSPDEETVPGVPIIRSTVRDLSLWRKVGIAERPTIDLVIQWLNTLPEHKPLSQEDARRVRALLGRLPGRIWSECRHWLNLAGDWVPTSDLSFALTMQSPVPWQHLFDSVLQRTADLKALRAEDISAPPFSNLPLLVNRVENRLARHSMHLGELESKEWLVAVGVALSRVDLEDAEETNRVRALARNLAATKWMSTSGLEVVPYIDGTPAGTSKRTDVVWLNGALYVNRLLPKARMAKLVPEEIEKLFGRSDIKSALDFSFERSPQDVQEYLETNFKLAPRVTAHDTRPEGEKPSNADTPETEIADEETRGESEAQATEPNDDSDAKASAAGGLCDGDSETPGEQAEPGGTETEPDEEAPTRRQRRQVAPSVMERFARLHGFSKDRGERFSHPDGSWIGKTDGEVFPWQHRSADGDTVRYYLPKDHCLERKPLELDAEIWALMDNHPDTYSLILMDTGGNPIEKRGAHLRGLRERGMLTLHPASFRLVLEQD